MQIENFVITIMFIMGAGRKRNDRNLGSWLNATDLELVNAGTNRAED